MSAGSVHDLKACKLLRLAFLYRYAAHCGLLRPEVAPAYERIKLLVGACRQDFHAAVRKIAYLAG